MVSIIAGSVTQVRFGLDCFMEARSSKDNVALMDELLKQIRQLPSEMEDVMGTGAASIGDRDFSALELRFIIREIVDDLQPLLSPYQGAFYWYMLRNSGR